MKNLLVSLLSLFALCAPASAQQKQSNVAYQDHQVRITLITDGVARLEYSPNGKFVDDYSQVAVNRTYAPVAFKLSQGGKNVKISTKAMVISYKKGTGRFSADNLTIASANKKAKGAFTWHPGLKDEANLKGTYRTLDGYDGNMRKGKPMPIEDGLLSRSGWTFIDDSKSYLFDHSDWPWVAERDTTADAQDWYFMAYGHNYKKALNDYTVFSGKVPLPPKFAFGYWWSRYWSYSDDEMRQLVKDFHDYDIPLDVLVVDMDWHYNQSPRGGWTGYTWNRSLFPSPEGFLGWLSMQDGPEYALAGGTRRVLVDDVFSDGSRIFEPGAFTGTWEQFVELGASGWEEFLPWCRCLMELCGGDLSRLKDRLDASGGRVARLIPGGAAEAYRYWMDSEAFAEHCRQQGIDQA